MAVVVVVVEPLSRPTRADALQQAWLQREKMAVTGRGPRVVVDSGLVPRVEASIAAAEMVATEEMA